jgi:DNA-binding HxlR family transcriptional regulator
VTDAIRLDETSCRRLTTALEFVGRRWTGAILLALHRGATRFSEIRRLIPDISDRMLAARLKELEQHGLVIRTVVPTMPVQVRYEVAQRGAAVLEIMRPLVEVGAVMEDEATREPARRPALRAG